MFVARARGLDPLPVELHDPPGLFRRWRRTHCRCLRTSASRVLPERRPFRGRSISQLPPLVYTDASCSPMQRSSAWATRPLDISLVGTRRSHRRSSQADSATTARVHRRLTVTCGAVTSGFVYSEPCGRREQPAAGLAVLHVFGMYYASCRRRGGVYRRGTHAEWLTLEAVATHSALFVFTYGYSAPAGLSRRQRFVARTGYGNEFCNRFTFYGKPRCAVRRYSFIQPASCALTAISFGAKPAGEPRRREHQFTFRGGWSVR